jgi:NAD(P)-dependent dehydrogenase (short-subunit alcohol dehydrogenase family)
VNNAGISLHEKNMMEVTIDTFDQQLSTNLKGPYFLTQEFLKHCQITHNTNASIIFMASERGLYCDEIPYGLIKSAIISLTRGVARRQIKNGIRVNAVAPGITESDMTIVDRTGDMASSYNCGGRFFLPEEVAETIVFLLSDAAKCISGEVIACDQGNYLRCDW